MDFSDLCRLFDDIRQSKVQDKKSLFKRYFRECRETRTKEQIYSLFKLISPKLDRERASYNMKESKIARVLIKMLVLPEGHDKNVLKKSYLMSGQASDFGDVVYSVIRKYLTQHRTSLTVEELNEQLDKLATKTKEIEAENILIGLFRKCSPEDSRWIIRIILKDLKLGIGNNQILNCYHRDGENYFASNVNLRKLCETLYDENVNLHELKIEVFEAFRPMLSKQVDATVFKKYFPDDRLFFVENKFDGERFQLHMHQGVFKYFSRNGYDYTDIYGATTENGLFTPLLKDAFASSVDAIILDGEMMLWNKRTQRYGSKGMDLDVKKLKSDGIYQPCFCVYDMILLNNEILTNRALKERVNLLRRVFKKMIPGTVVLSEIRSVDTRQGIIDQLNEAVRNEEEGIIVKDPESVYKYSDRNSGWYKMKLEYFQNTMNDLDLIVMGGQYGSSTSDQLNSFIVGLLSGRSKEGKPVFSSLGKVSSGLGDDQLDLLNRKLKTEGKRFDEGKHSDCLIFGHEQPNYYIEPDSSLVFTVRASELIKTKDSSFMTSYTLRFPRVLKVRTDKPMDECLTVNELLALTSKNKSVIKLNKSEITLEEILSVKTRKVKKRAIEVIRYADTAQISDLFEGYSFYVLNGTEEEHRDDVEALIRRAGGQIKYKADETVDIVLVGVYDERAKRLSGKRNHFDVVDLKWLYRVVREGNLLGYETLEIYCPGNNIRNCLNDEMDRYGDHYSQEATIETLKHSFEIMENLDEEPYFVNMIKLPYEINYSDFNAYFDKYELVGDKSSKVIYDCLEDELEFRYHFGKVCDNVGTTTNLIVTQNGGQRLEYLKNYLRNIQRDDVQIKNRSELF